MRFIFQLNLSLFLLRVVSARSIILARAELPICVQTCFPTAVGASGCPATDAPCICDSQTFYESLLPCVLTYCGFADVSGLLTYGLDFCDRTGVNSAQRLSVFGKSASGGGNDDDTSISTSAAPVEPTFAPEPEPVSSADPIPTVISSVSSTAAVTPPIVEDATTIKSISQIEPTVPAVPTALTGVSTTTSAPVVGPKIETSILKISFSSTSTESLPEVESTSIIMPIPTPRSRTPSDQFIVETTSQKSNTDTDLVVIQTVDPTSKKTQAAATTAPGKTSAPPTPTADEPSSASASALHMFNQSSFNSFLLCLVTLLFVF